MQLKVTILFQIVIVIISNSLSEFQIESDSETENIGDENENGPNQINKRQHISYWKNKKELGVGQKYAFSPKSIQMRMATKHPFQPEMPPIYTHFISPEKIQTQMDLIEERYYDQLIDHNDPSAGTFKQKYLVYKEFCQYDLDNGIHSEHPQVFAVFGSEAVKDNFYHHGFFMDDARKYNACCVQLEHRQFGKSTIGKDASVKNLEFLKTDQTLDDMARFIKFFNQEYKIKYKRWAFYGCSVPGTYVSRFAVRHPELYEFGIASAACRQTFYDFHHFYDTMGDVLEATSPKCRRTVKEAFDSVTDLVREARSKCKNSFHHCPVAERNTEILKKYLQLCGNFSIFEEINTQEIIYDSTYELGVLTIYNNIANNVYGVTVQDFYEDINAQTTTNQPYDSLKKFYEANCKLVKKWTGLPLDPSDPNFVPCKDFCVSEINWRNNVEYYQQTDWSADVSVNGERQWMWMICQYYGNFLTTSGPNSAFGKILTTFYYQQQCNQYFNNRFNYAAERLTFSENNKLYGRLKGIPGSCPSCTLFVTHGRDPWKGCQMLHVNDINCGGYDNKFVLYSNGSHCATTYPDNFDDPNDGNLKKAKREIHEAIDHWMTEGCKHRTHVQCPR